MRRNIVIADSGGSKTHWIMSNNKTYVEFFSSGLHPKEITPQKIEEVKDLFKGFSLEDYTLYFYGTGCLKEVNQEPVKRLLSILNFKQTQINGDVLGSCKAALRDEPGCVLILGTGSVGLKYDGSKIIKTYGGLGYPKGDEGSGAQMGRSLLKSFQQKELPKNLNEQLNEFCLKEGINCNENLDTIDRKQIATLTRFIHKHKEHDHIQNLLAQAFEALYNTTIAPMETNSISLTGSVAFYFKEELQAFLFSKQIVVNRIVKYPALNLYSLHYNQR